GAPGGHGNGTSGLVVGAAQVEADELEECAATPSCTGVYGSCPLIPAPVVAGGLLGTDVEVVAFVAVEGVADHQLRAALARLVVEVLGDPGGDLLRSRVVQSAH